MEVCHHGQLKRSCRICELEFDLADATACYNRQMEMRLSAEWFAKAWKRAAKEWRDKGHNEFRTYLGRAAQQDMANVVQENACLRSENAALKAKIEALPDALVWGFCPLGNDYKEWKAKLAEKLSEHFNGCS